ncbi:hypothetical protein OE88DRAFT_1809755 [Heliocybe sulcata]|uniref:DNA replication regulator Sld3 C-terminal domain-containing protein n=1 Tax=Heliocybe sulcata TaxID=5364 RepID=A0A5C3MWZ1_9AGAM|nr:hypothetical protein OE88DRAFT_1809755 [Heliocybe sulcata]
MSVLPFELNLDLAYPLKWTTFNSSSRDLPFYGDRSKETPDQYVVRTYLQFLWLPESIMPLKLLVPSLLRVLRDPTSATEAPHPLHAFLEPILLTSCSCANKYHTEVPQILADEGGSGDIEEGTMWFAVNYEKGDEEVAAAGAGSQDVPNPGEEKWKKKWLERMERREVQIQIILHMLLLSLPGPPPVPSSSPKKRKRSGVAHDSPSKGDSPKGHAALESRIESFMDKLSTWQLLSSLDQEDGKGEDKDKDAEILDWMQTFCRDIVEPQFKVTLPQQTDLLRSKLFPHSAFSPSSRSTSPASRSPSPFSASTKRSRTGSKGPSLQRSRSLSLSLAEDRMDVVPGRKKLSREVSMNRVFKPKTKPVNEVRSKAKTKLSREESARPAKDAGMGTTLVVATPVKNKARVEYSDQRRSPSFGRRPSLSVKGEDDDELLLGGGLDEDGEEDWDIGGSVLVSDTPTKPRRLR